MNTIKNVRLTYGMSRVRKTKHPNSKCIKCGVKFYSFQRSLGFEGVSCAKCGGNGEWQKEVAR